MRAKLFFVPLLLFALASSGLAQVDRPTIKNKPDAPLQITEAHCGQSALASTSDLPQGNYYYCHATLQFADTQETWDGYGLLWIVTYEDGRKNPFYQTSDRSLPPPPGVNVKARRPFQPREIVDIGRPGMGFSKKDRNGKAFRPTGAEVEVEFVINTNGTVWGDTKSPTYQHIVEARKKAKEEVKEGTAKEEKQ